MDSLPFDALSSCCLAAFEQNASDSSGQLLLGKHGVYLIDRAEKVPSFRLIPWQEIVPAEA